MLPVWKLIRDNHFLSFTLDGLRYTLGNPFFDQGCDGFYQRYLVDSVSLEKTDMDDTAASPIVVPLLFVLRCLIPVLLLFGLSYLLRKLGLISEPPASPPDEQGDSKKAGKGDLLHGAI